MSSETPIPPPPETPVTGTTQTAGQSINEGEGRIFPCEGCGADLKFHIGQQQLKCPFCGYQKELQQEEGVEVLEQDLPAMLERIKELSQQKQSARTEGEEEEKNELRCDACGGTVVFVGPLTSTECPYCASPIQRDKVHTAHSRIGVDGILPFLITKDEAQENLADWVRSRWFAPNEFKKRGVSGQFNGVYLPFWTFDAMTCNRYVGERGEHYWVTQGSGDSKKRVRKTRWHHANGTFQRFFDDVLVLAAIGLNHKLMLQLEPWPLDKCIPFTPEVLAGYYARTYEVQLDEGLTEAQERIVEALRVDVKNRIGGDEQRIRSLDTQYSAMMFKHLLLPVWLLAYSYQEKTYQVMINAATGEVQGERPYSWVKITLTVLAALAVVGTIVLIVNS